MISINDLVKRDVIYNASLLVSELTKKYEEFPEFEEELLTAYYTEPDHEECLIDHGWTMGNDGSCHTWVNPEGEVFYGWNAQDLCEEHDLGADDYRQDVYEHWIVTDRMAYKLEKKGERVLKDFFGLTVWGRCTSGQAISCDHVIKEIHKDMTEMSQ